MTIKEGFDSKETEIRVRPRNEDGQRQAEVWIKQPGLKIPRERTELIPIKEYSKKQPDKAYKDMRVVADQTGDKFVMEKSTTETESETLSYITLNELLDLRDEINAVLQEITR